jgi:hypothetical protein
MFRSLFVHLQAEYTILVLEIITLNNGSVVLYSIFHYRVLYVARSMVCLLWQHSALVNFVDLCDGCCVRSK